MVLALGRIVHYALGTVDAEQITKRRRDATTSDFAAQNTGAMIHAGNPVAPGQVFPAVVVAAFGEATANLKVLLDGNDELWATSRVRSPRTEAGPIMPGTWDWPEIQG